MPPWTPLRTPAPPRSQIPSNQLMTAPWPRRQRLPRPLPQSMADWMMMSPMWKVRDHHEINDVIFQRRLTATPGAKPKRERRPRDEPPPPPPPDFSKSSLFICAYCIITPWHTGRLKSLLPAACATRQRKISSAAHAASRTGSAPSTARCRDCIMMMHE